MAGIMFPALPVHFQGPGNQYFMIGRQRCALSWRHVAAVVAAEQGVEVGRHPVYPDRYSRWTPHPTNIKRGGQPLMVIGQGAVPDRAMRKQVWGPIGDGDQVFLGGGGKLD